MLAQIFIESAIRTNTHQGPLQRSVGPFGDLSESADCEVRIIFRDDLLTAQGAHNEGSHRQQATGGLHKKAGGGVFDRHQTFTHCIILQTEQGGEAFRGMRLCIDRGRTVAFRRRQTGALQYPQPLEHRFASPLREYRRREALWPRQQKPRLAPNSSTASPSCFRLIRANAE